MPQGNEVLRAQFNLIGIASRYHGRTQCTITYEYDLWVAACDIAYVLDQIEAPPVHLVAPQALAVHLAYRAVALFPERFASLTLSGLSNFIEYDSLSDILLTD